MTLSVRKCLFFIKKNVRHLIKSVSQLYGYLFMSLATPPIWLPIFILSLSVSCNGEHIFTNLCSEFGSTVHNELTFFG